MNITGLEEKILQGIEKSQASNFIQNVIYKTSPATLKHEFVFFIKPEITVKDDRIKLPSILKLMFGKLIEFKFEITEVRILGAAYLEKFNIISQHYGVINAMSRKAFENLTPEGKQNFNAMFGKEPEKDSLIGGLEFLDRFKEFDAVSLGELWQKSKVLKLAGGTYCSLVTIQGEPVYLVNGFHPKQLIHFTETGRSIVVFHIASDIDWAIARNRFIGKTNPEDAMQGSLRYELLKHKSAFGLDEVNSGRNGFHLSAGPVEGLVELMRYFSDFIEGDIKKPAEFLFGRQLQTMFTEVEIKRICENSNILYNGSGTNVFDLTEEKNADVALKLLAEGNLNQ